jgi:hypothetical protein
MKRDAEDVSAGYFAPAVLGLFFGARPAFLISSDFLRHLG